MHDDVIRLPDLSPPKVRPRCLDAAPSPAAASPEDQRHPSGRYRYVAFTAATFMAVLLFALVPLATVLRPAGGDVNGSEGGVLTLLTSGATSGALVALTMLAGLRWGLFFALAFVTHRRQPQRSNATPEDELPLVSINVPAYNEGETIGPALRSLVQIDYPRFEIIVVDDGSGDETFEHAKPFEGNYGNCTVRVYRKPNGGKWSALNFAFHRSVGELVLCVDADSRLGRDALRLLVEQMRDPQVSAVAGQVRVRNRDNLITRLQALEYIIANGLVRMAQGATGTVLVVPGPIGLFRRTALEDVYLRFGCRGDIDKPGEIDGPFEGDTFAEDFDLSLALLSLGGRCVYEPRAISFTKSPDTAPRLINQRYRWCRGTIQVLRKYIKRAGASRDLRHRRLAAWLGLTYGLELLVMPLVNAAILVLVLVVLAGGGSIVPLLGWVLAFMLLNLNAAAFFVAVHGDRLRTLWVAPMYDLYHGVLLNSSLAIAVADEIRGRSMRW